MASQNTQLLYQIIDLIKQTEARLIHRMDTRMDAMEARINHRMDSRMDAMEARINHRMDTRMDAIDYRLDKLENQMTFVINYIERKSRIQFDELWFPKHSNLENTPQN